MGSYKHFFKSIFDFTLSLIGLIILSPVFLQLWLLLAIANKGTFGFFIQAHPFSNAVLLKGMP